MEQYAENNEMEHTFSMQEDVHSSYTSFQSMDEYDKALFKNYPLLLPFVDGTNSYRLDIQTLREHAIQCYTGADDFATNGTIVAVDDPIWVEDPPITVKIEEPFHQATASAASQQTGDTMVHYTMAVIAIDQNSNEQTTFYRSWSEASATGNNSTMSLLDISNLPRQPQRRRSRQKNSKRSSYPEHCVFCLNNGKCTRVYKSHRCRNENGDVTCPFLKCYVCPHCGATGSQAHTPKYCPMKPIITPEDCLEIERRLRASFRKAGDASMTASASSVESITPRIRL
uniref:Nanos-type domain-containing protein n=1 Tax=Anopheles dirus TaxID=7168 RepID=A0A182NM66_9DIPT